MGFLEKIGQMQERGASAEERAKFIDGYRRRKTFGKFFLASSLAIALGMSAYRNRVWGIIVPYISPVTEQSKTKQDNPEIQPKEKKSIVYNGFEDKRRVWVSYVDALRMTWVEDDRITVFHMRYEYDFFDPFDKDKTGELHSRWMQIGNLEYLDKLTGRTILREEYRYDNGSYGIDVSYGAMYESFSAFVTQKTNTIMGMWKKISQYEIKVDEDVFGVTRNSDTVFITKNNIPIKRMRIEGPLRKENEFTLLGTWNPLQYSLNDTLVAVGAKTKLFIVKKSEEGDALSVHIIDIINGNSAKFVVPWEREDRGMDVGIPWLSGNNLVFESVWGVILLDINTGDRITFKFDDNSTLRYAYVGEDNQRYYIIRNEKMVVAFEK